MTDIGFYHLTRTGPEQALPQLLARTLGAGQRALVLCGDEARVADLDESLWAEDWLPHGTARMGQADLQPIWITAADECPNAARYLFTLDGAATARWGEYDRVFDLFDGRDPAAVAAARTRWTAAKAAGHSLTYWQQGERGWTKQA